jgi:hypothetical protein
MSDDQGMTTPCEGTLFLTRGFYDKYAQLDGLVRRHFGVVEWYALLYADPARTDLVVDLSLPVQQCDYGTVRADGASINREVCRLAAANLVPIGSVHRHGINVLSLVDENLLENNLALEMAPALLRPFEQRTPCTRVEFELGPQGRLTLDEEILALGRDEGQPRRLVLHQAEAVRTEYRARVFCLASRGGAKPRFHGQEIEVSRIPECPTPHTRRLDLKQVIMVPGDARLPADEETLEREILDKLSLRSRYGYGAWGWNRGKWQGWQ